MTPTLESLIAERLAGRSPAVPRELEAEFELAIAGHAALEDLFVETGCELDTQTPDRAPPRLPGDYEIERELGRGGMGVVYLVLQRSLARRVALKVLRASDRLPDALLKRFQDEARHLARLRHPHIVSIHEVGETGGEPYFTMDFIDGEPLSALLKRGPLPPSQSVAILRQVAGAVQHAHAQGIIHRDLKPANVLLDGSGHAFVSDFGLARDVRQASQLTGSGEMLGTPQYMSPEQARGDAALVGEGTDIHSLGLLLYEMLAGRSPFASRTAADTLVRLLNEEAAPLRSIDRRIPRDLETICLTMLAKTPQGRYASVSALLEDLRRYEAGEPLVARRRHWLRRGALWCRRHWKLAAASAATAVLMLALAPRMFDKSYAELVAWGDEEFAAGQTDLAGRVYLRALDRADETQRADLTGRLSETVRRHPDPDAAVGIALRVIDAAPEASFGRYDALVAQALVARLRDASPSRSLEFRGTVPREALRLARTRLEIALLGDLPDNQRADADAALQAINLALGTDRSWTRVDATHLARLPVGPDDELRLLADGVNQPQWNRGKAALALGRRLEQAGQPAAALESYRQARELMREVYPIVGGIKLARGASNSLFDAPDAEECQLVAEADAAVRRLSPDPVPAQRGSLRFAVQGVDLPPSMGVELTLIVCDPAIDDPHRGLSHNLPRQIPIRSGQAVDVPILDGTYRLAVRGFHSRWDDQVEAAARRLQVDTQNWPTEIDVRGGVMELPAVELRFADEIRLESPVAGANVDLSEVEFVWSPVEGATRYVVQLMYVTESPHPTQAMFAFPETAAPRLKLTETPEHIQRQVRENLIPGRNGGWNVDAYDSEGRKLGMSSKESRFLVVAELPESR
ncbi:MAG: serine/threonine protein kinase [Planctomyces sp.]|nr:serine/threonine protein kinase [Planctomyces sp.]